MQAYTSLLKSWLTLSLQCHSGHISSENNFREPVETPRFYSLRPIRPNRHVRKERDGSPPTHPANPAFLFFRIQLGDANEMIGLQESTA
jgi:hypothetical protein